MNTKQKLTLGIAAIFMVTLTIVGVTYAYFVTRVNYSEQAKVQVQTATIGSAFISAENSTKLEKAFPGDKAYGLFAIKNASAVPVSAFLNLATSLKAKSDGKITANEFVHSSLDANDLKLLCYKESAVPMAIDTYNGEGGTSKIEPSPTPTAGCYNATTVASGQVPRYNNIVVRLYRIPTTGDSSKAWSLGANDTTTNANATHFAGTGEQFVTINVTPKNEVGEANVARLAAIGTRVTLGGSAMEEHAPYIANYGKPIMDSTGNAITISDVQVVEAKADGATSDVYNLYMLEVEYQNVDANQNIENDAYLNLKVDFSIESIKYSS